MELKIWSEESKQEKDDKQIFLRLDNFKNEGVVLIACDKNGDEIECGGLLFVDNKCKCFISLTNINDSIPLKTDIYNSVLCYSTHEYEELRIDLAKQSFMKEMKKKSEEEENKLENKSVKH